MNFWEREWKTRVEQRRLEHTRVSINQKRPEVTRIDTSAEQVRPDTRVGHQIRAPAQTRAGDQSRRPEWARAARVEQTRVGHSRLELIGVDQSREPE